MAAAHSQKQQGEGALSVGHSAALQHSQSEEPRPLGGLRSLVCPRVSCAGPFRPQSLRGWAGALDGTDPWGQTED